MRAYLEESDQIKKDTTGKVTLKGRTGINRQKEEKRVFRHRNSQCKIHVEREDGKQRMWLGGWSLESEKQHFPKLKMNR